MKETLSSGERNHSQTDNQTRGNALSGQLTPPASPHAGLQESPLDFQVGMASDSGPYRERNEDACFALQLGVMLHEQQPLSVGLFIIADGLGGHTGGEQASSLATRLAARQIVSQIYLPALSEGQSLFELPPVNEVLEAAIRTAEQAVRRQFPGAGTTMTLALTLGDGVYVAHVGDSRAYIGEHGHLVQITRDHSMAARLIELGQATPEEARSQRHVLYRAVGQGADTEPDIVYRPLARQQYLMLCCDGLWGVLTDEEMVRIIDASATPGAACRSLAARATENGSEDNISVILAARDWHGLHC